MASGYINLPVQGSNTWKDPVANVAALPLTGNNTGDARITNDNQAVNVWSGAAWVAGSGSGTVTSVGLTVPAFLSVAGSPVTGAGTLAVSLSGTALPVANGGTGLTSGTSGGVIGYTASGTLASSVLLTNHALVLGAGAGATPTPMGSLGTTTTVLHGNAAGAPTFAAIDVAADITGVVPVANGGTALSSGTSGGILAFTASGVLASSGALIANQLIKGGGAGVAPSTLTAGSQYQPLVMGAANPGYAALDLTQTAATTGALLIARGGTNSAASLNNNRVMQSSGGAIVEASAITASRALASDSNGIPVAATTTTTELNYVSGVTSAIQTQFTAKAPLASPVFTGSVKFGNYHIEPAEYDAGNSGASITLDMSNGASVKVTLNNATPAITLSNAQAGGAYLLKIVQDGSGNRVPSFSTSIDWGSLGAPTFSTGINKIDFVNLYYDGSAWYGMSYALGY